MIDRLVYRESVGFRQKKTVWGRFPWQSFFFAGFLW